MPISPNFTSVLYKDWEINFLQCYPNGNLKYTELCNLFQLTAAAHSELGGISFSDMQEFHQAWVLSKMLVEVDKLPKWKDKVTVKTWIKSLKNSRSVRCLELYLGEEKVVGCETFWAVFNTQTRRPEALALPSDQFEKYPEASATHNSFSKINIQNEPDCREARFTTIAKRQVALSDLDIVNHMNSVKYLEWCLDTINPKDLILGKLKSFEMNYLKELSLSDQATIAQNESVITINKDGKTCFALSFVV